MMCALKDLERQDRVHVRLVCVPDEESEELDERSTDGVVKRGLGGDFAITGEPTDMHIGVEAKGVLVMRIVVHGRAAHSSTPWLGDNAVLKAIDVFRAIESLPFSRESSEMFDRPSINLGRIHGGDALNKVPDECTMAVDVRYLPGQDPAEILEQVREIDDIDVTRTFIWPPVTVSRADPYVRALRDAVAAVDARRRHGDGRRPRRGVRRRLVHRGGDSGGRVRAIRRRPPRARGVGLAVLTGPLPPGAVRVRARAADAPGGGDGGARSRRRDPGPARDRGWSGVEAAPRLAPRRVVAVLRSPA